MPLPVLLGFGGPDAAGRGGSNASGAGGGAGGAGRPATAAAARPKPSPSPSPTAATAAVPPPYESEDRADGADSTAAAVITLKDKGYQVATLEATATTSLFEFKAADNLVCVLGGESEGIGREVAVMADTRLTVPMANGVESLNVAATAALVSFHLGQSRD